ncbi:hypothetical protein [Sphingomonas sp. Leaf25]|uniref:hypothetical protein n=1 Tax=Sphingomonas sp. Leaf25 TaxID=1735692 RepID=UPI000AF79951|nr:hypothetical protein [Sphingomonas sp. Leaf25]
MRVGLGCLIALSAIGSGCAAGSSPSSIGTAIYVPPVRLGGTGSVMFLPASQPAIASADEAIIRAALKHVAAPGQCVTPMLALPPFGELGDMARQAAAPIARIPAAADPVRSRSGSWYDMAGRPIDPRTAARIDHGIAMIVAAIPGESASAPLLILPAWLGHGQSIGNDTCDQVRLSRPARYGTLAFVSVDLRRDRRDSQGELLAFDGTGGRWRVIAQQTLWIT